MTALVWHRSSRCSSGGCVEVAHDRGLIRVRDSKNPDRPAIAWPPEMWTASVLGRITAGLLPAGASLRSDETVGWRGTDEHGTPADLEFTADEWADFTAAVQAAEFDPARLTR